MKTIKASDLKVGDVVKYNNRFREVTEVTFGEWKSVAKSDLIIPMVFFTFSTFKNNASKGQHYLNTLVTIK